MPLDDATAARVDKLPRHARDLIERLQRNLDHANAKLAEGPCDSDTFADPYSETPRPLGQGTLVQFGASKHEGTWKVHVEEGQLNINFQALGNYDMVIIPVSSNVVRLESRPRYRTAHS
jgi:hypothetical protein